MGLDIDQVRRFPGSGTDKASFHLDLGRGSGDRGAALLPTKRVVDNLGVGVKAVRYIGGEEGVL